MPCCCEQGEEECDTAPCGCASSYIVNGINFTYNFSIDSNGTEPTCESGCLGSVCYNRYWNISVTVAQAFFANVNRQNSCAPNLACGYYGDVVFNVTATVELFEEARCMGTGNPLNRTLTQTWTNNLTVSGCVHVTCRRIGKPEGCPPMSGSPRLVWHHTVEICDFPVACDNVFIMGYQYPGDFVRCGMDCDDTGASPAACGPFALRCIGGTLSFITPYECLDQLDGQPYSCLGWYRPRRCLAPCTGVEFGTGASILSGNTAVLGAFGCFFTDECQELEEDEVCRALRVSSNTYPNLKTIGWTAPVDLTLTDYCGYTDEVINFTPCPEGDVRVFQSACPAAMWTYT